MENLARVVDDSTDAQVFKCAKCLTYNKIACCITDTAKEVPLCELCSAGLGDNIHRIDEFLREDFGDCPVNWVFSNMIKDRLKKAKNPQ